MKVLIKKITNNYLILFVIIISLFFPSIVLADSIKRSLPKPLPDHPGNIFLVGENVIIPNIANNKWYLTDYENNIIQQGETKNGQVILGKLPIGYYELHTTVEQYTTIGVLAPLLAPTPINSPISIDVAMAWFYKKVDQPKVANLCTLAGINWVRDRLNWAEIEPQKAQFVTNSKYDDTAQTQAAAKLQILQVNHISPKWANTEQNRFPSDLRDVFNFYKEVAHRWQGEIKAYEPWNEAEWKSFGGHSGGEIASFQKTAYLGLKAGHPKIIVGMTPLMSANNTIIEDLKNNNLEEYFDTYNFHNYADIVQYPKIFASFSQISANKPLWVSEASLPVKHTIEADKKNNDVPHLQTEHVVMIYASSIYAGAEQVFYFMLPYYIEKKIQYGILNKDLTPRPAFLAISACGRLLAGAQPICKLPASTFSPLDNNTNVFVFRAWPDGKERDVMVGWTTGNEIQLQNKITPLAIYDHLGRPAEITTSVTLSHAPLFIIFPKGTFQQEYIRYQLSLPKKDTPSSIVLQSVWPKEKTILENSAYSISSQHVESIPIYIYNFGTTTVSGTLEVKASTKWKVTFPTSLDIQPGERKKLLLNIDCQEAPTASIETITIYGQFGINNRSVLSLRLQPQTDNQISSINKKLLEISNKIIKKLNI